MAVLKNHRAAAGCTVADVERAMKSWLKHSKDRDGWKDTRDKKRREAIREQERRSESLRKKRNQSETESESEDDYKS